MINFLMISLVMIRLLKKSLNTYNVLGDFMLDCISVSEFKKMSNVEIIDIRNAHKYFDSHILGARNIPFEQLLMSPSKYLNKNIKYYIYCQKGIKSKQLCQILKKSGYNVINIIGGYEAWIMNS